MGMEKSDFGYDRELRLTRDELGFVRVAAVSPALQVADVKFNTLAIIDGLEACAAQDAQLALFPELCITGYTCGDLFFQRTLLDAAEAALFEIAGAAQYYNVAAMVGLPLAVEGRLYNCAAFIAGGEVLGVAPKIFLPTYKEYYELRWFRSGDGCRNMTATVNGHPVPFGVDLLFQARNMPDCMVGMEICEALWTVHPPSGGLQISPDLKRILTLSGILGLLGGLGLAYVVDLTDVAVVGGRLGFIGPMNLVAIDFGLVHAKSSFPQTQ